MNCRKCKKVIDADSNFCKYCGEAQREKFPECSHMEIIGRPVCETRFAEASKRKIEYIFERSNVGIEIRKWYASLPHGILTGTLGVILSQIRKKAKK